jgi:hypothetical protein
MAYAGAWPRGFGAYCAARKPDGQMKKKLKSKAPFTTKPGNKYSFPVPIPPCSVPSVRRQARSPWAGEVGRRFKVGYYGKMDGLDCIWLVDEKGGI